MNNTILKAPICELKELNNLFIEMTAKNCNMRCKNCYIDFPLNKHVKDFIPVDFVKKALIDTKSEKIQCIYLTGAEPMTHPDFNSILRLCLKRSNVCIFTNGSFINEKKARFLKRVEDEGNNEIIFKLSMDHYDEIKNDEVRTRGSYRTTLNAVKNLAKYGFNPIICVTNVYKENPKKIKEELKSVLLKTGFSANDNNFVINECYYKTANCDFSDNMPEKADCMTGRILTAKGVWTCPFLTNDFRGRCGSDFSNFSKHNSLETDFCAYCQKNNKEIFSIDFNMFK